MRYNTGTLQGAQHLLFQIHVSSNDLQRNKLPHLFLSRALIITLSYVYTVYRGIQCVSKVLGTVLNIYIFTSRGHLVVIPLLVQHPCSRLVLGNLIKINWKAFFQARFDVFCSAR